jgi:hypothetical protein
MPVELCWPVDYTSAHSSSPQPLPMSYTAPSWSWASVHGPLAFVDKHRNSPFEPLVAVVDVHCEVPRLNKYGEVTWGYLVIRGPVVSMTINCADPYDCWTYTVGDNPETREPMAPDCILHFEIDNAKYPENKSLRRAQKGDKPVPFSMDTTCIRIGNEIGESGSFLYGMILGLSESDADVYTRLGLVVLDCEDWFEGTVEKTLKIA